MTITLIYTQTDKLLITKEEVNWQTWQEKLYWFKTSLPFDNIISCADFLKENFVLAERHKEFIIETVCQNNCKIFELYISKENKVKVVPLQMNLLQSKGQIIDWVEWEYFYTKQKDDYILWVYMGGIAEQVREIKLSSLQVKSWQEKGNEFIKELSKDLQKKDSNAYLDAINGNRKTL